jgi:predicted acyltransferase
MKSALPKSTPKEGKGTLTTISPDTQVSKKASAAALPSPRHSVISLGTERMVSLDVFRGITIAAMILVNNPGTWGSVYAPLRHAEWNGWTPTDLVFPFFLFIVGVSITLSFARRMARGETRAELFKQVARRTLIIFALGLFLNGFPYFNLSHIRIPGVLQRIAVCYGLAAVIYLTTKIRGQVLATVTLLAGYWILLTAVPIPGIGHSSLTIQSNLAAYIDNALLHGHIYRPTWDPEGILSTLPAVASVLLGILTGHWLRRAKTPLSRLRGLLLAGAAGVLAGQFMSFWFPINKNLWTSSYTVFTAGMALVLFGICYWLVDMQGRRKWATPFVVYGMNAIAVYVLSGLAAKASVTWKVTQADGSRVLIQTFLYANFFAPLASPLNASLMWALAYVVFWLGVMWVFYWRKIFIKI